MSGESRLLGKQIILADGIQQRGDSTGPAIFFEGGKIVATRPIALGSPDSPALSCLTAVASVDFGAIPPTGTLNAATAVDVEMAGVEIGDWVHPAPIVSYDDRMFFSAACYSAGAVHLVAEQNGSGAFNADNITFRIFAIRPS